jgi:hypothetical protein
MAIGTNYLVTYDQVKNSLYVPVNAAYSGDTTKIMTKQDLITYFYVDSSYLTGYTSLQCVMYQDIHTQPAVTVTINAQKILGTGTFYLYYGIQDTTLVSPVNLAAIPRPGATIGTISVIPGQTLTLTTSDVSGPHGTNGSKPTTAQTGSYPAASAVCTGYVTFTITAATTYYVTCNNGYVAWC